MNFGNCLRIFINLYYGIFALILPKPRYFSLFWHTIRVNVHAAPDTQAHDFGKFLDEPSNHPIINFDHSLFPRRRLQQVSYFSFPFIGFTNLLQFPARNGTFSTWLSKYILCPYMFSLVRG